MCAKQESLAGVVPAFLLQKKRFPAIGYFGEITIVKVHISRDMIRPFTGEGDVVAWLNKVKPVVRHQLRENVAGLLPLYLEGEH